ncbi:MAG: IclR family transcriptional regulator [Pseudomonadota bacterium]|nr:IclR family transcriptional regulator [Pseudomonadota bacterium]
MPPALPPDDAPPDAAPDAAPKRQRHIQSIEVGMRVLDALAAQARPLPLKALAQLADMPPGKAHPYLVSFMNVGLVRQNALTGLYELGPGALRLGLAALQRLDPLTEASADAAQLAVQSGLSVALVVRGNLGPTVVRLDEPHYPLHMNLRVGTVMSMLGTVTGRVFAAHLPGKMVRTLIADEHDRVVGARAGAHPASAPGLGAGTDVARLDSEEMQQTLAHIRATGMGRGVGMPQPGVNTLCAPIFGADGQMMLAMTLVGPQGVFGAEPDSAVARLLRTHAQAVSARLGHTPQEMKKE